MLLYPPHRLLSNVRTFLSFLVKCNLDQKVYKIFGYKGKQVRDNIHSEDLVKAFYEFYLNPTNGEVYNIGGGIEDFQHLFATSHRRLHGGVNLAQLLNRLEEA